MSFQTVTLEHDETRLVFALLLRDRLDFSTTLQGDLSVTAGPRAGVRKGGTGTFLFFDLPNGPTDFAVRSAADTPFYLQADITLTMPPGSAQWPAFPDLTLADPALLLWDPAQPAAFRAQFLQACLTPAIAYPFDPASTLLRGTVLHASAPVADAAVFDLGGAAVATRTGDDGQFVLAFTALAASPATVTVRAQSAGHPDVDTNVTIRRAATTAVQISV